MTETVSTGIRPATAFRAVSSNSDFSVPPRGKARKQDDPRNKFVTRRGSAEIQVGSRLRGVIIDPADFLRCRHAGSSRGAEITNRPSGWRGFKARKRDCTRRMPRTRQQRDGSKLQFMFNCPGSSLTRTRYGLYKRDVYLRSPASNWVDTFPRLSSPSSSFFLSSYFRSFNIPAGA